MTMMINDDDDDDDDVATPIAGNANPYLNHDQIASMLQRQRFAAGMKRRMKNDDADDDDD